MKQMQEEKSAEMIKMQEIAVMRRKKMKACKWCLMKLWEEIHNF